MDIIMGRGHFHELENFLQDLLVLMTKNLLVLKKFSSRKICVRLDNFARSFCLLFFFIWICRWQQSLLEPSMLCRLCDFNKLRVFPFLGHGGIKDDMDKVALNVGLWLYG